MATVLRIKKTATRVIRFGGGKTAGPTAPRIVTADPAALLVGKAVFFALNGERVAGKAIRAANGELTIDLAVPSRDGLLLTTGTELTVKASDVEPTKALLSQKRVQAFEAGAEIRLPAEQKFATILRKEGGEGTEVVADYRDVVIEGYASTFGTPDKRDRGGEYVMPGAWTKTLADFRKNPVILVDHTNKVSSIAGSWTKVGVDQRGLAVTGAISNAPGVRDTRFKLVEGHLKGLSIGGIWHYAEDRYGIEEIDLFEVSLVAVPMNAETLAYTRSVGPADCQKAFSRFWRHSSSLRDE